MKSWLICAAALIAASAYSQNKEAIFTSPDSKFYSKEELQKKDAQRMGYFAVIIGSGIYPTTNLSTFPVARFQYQYAGGNVINYADSLSHRGGSSKTGISAAFEAGSKNGAYISMAIGGLLGTKNSNVKTTYFSTSLGYNIRTGIPGVVLQPSIGFALTTVASHLKSIPQNETDIWTFNETLRYKNSCGCTSKTMYVTALNSTSFVQSKLAVKYNVNRVISFSVGATYYVPMQTSFHLEVKNKNDTYRRLGYVSQSVTAITSDNSNTSKKLIYGEATLIFNIVTPKRKHNIWNSSSGGHSPDSYVFVGAAHGCH